MQNKNPFFPSHFFHFWAHFKLIWYKLICILIENWNSASISKCDDDGWCFFPSAHTHTHALCLDWRCCVRKYSISKNPVAKKRYPLIDSHPIESVSINRLKLVVSCVSNEMARWYKCRRYSRNHFQLHRTPADFIGLSSYENRTEHWNIHA